MKRLLIILLCILFNNLLTSCWFSCAPAINGSIKDKNNEQLLDSVKVDVYEGSELTWVFYSDSLGRFSASAKSKSNFMFNNCERGFKLIFSKPGYKEQTYRGVAPDVNIEIYLER